MCPSLFSVYLICYFFFSFPLQVYFLLYCLLLFLFLISFFFFLFFYTFSIFSLPSFLLLCPFSTNLFYSFIPFFLSIPPILKCFLLFAFLSPFVLITIGRFFLKIFHVHQNKNKLTIDFYYHQILQSYY